MLNRIQSITSEKRPKLQKIKRQNIFISHPFGLYSIIYNLLTEQNFSKE